MKGGRARAKHLRPSVVMLSAIHASETNGYSVHVLSVAATFSPRFTRRGSIGKLILGGLFAGFLLCFPNDVMRGWA